MGVKEVIEWNARNFIFRVVFTVDGQRAERNVIAESATAAKQKVSKFFPGQKVRAISVTKA